MLELNRNKDKKLTVEDEKLIMKLSPIYQARLDEREQIGLKKGIQQGVEQGIQQGIQQNVIRLLRKKVSDLPSDLLTRVMGLPINTLQDLSEALLDFNSIEDLINWLEKEGKA